jgi:hypothetical protein
MSRNILEDMAEGAAHGDWFIRWLIGGIVLLSMFMVALIAYSLIQKPVFTLVVATIFVTPYVIGQVLANHHDSREHERG